MNILAIDLGTYSVKLVEASIERRKSYIIRKKEVNILNATEQLDQKLSLQEVQLEIIKRYINANHFDGKIVFQAPNSILTRRFLELPVNNKRKAEMMIPFQLDDSLPYPASEAHYTTHFSTKLKKLKVTLNIASLENFEHFHAQITQRNLRPNILTSELSVINAAAGINKRISNYVLIDLGHDTTKVYFISKQEVISSHVSYVAGALIDEAISQTYNIPLSEASIYKHDNCFFLTENQYEDVTDDQAEFALLMKNIFAPFICDFKRWEIAQRIHTGGSFSEIYLLGGTSNIKNITNFLTQNLIHPVAMYSVDEHLKRPMHKGSVLKNIQYGISTIMALTSSTSGVLSSFLTGQYTPGSTQAISAHSMAFVMLRVFTLSIILIISLFIEKQLLQAHEKKLNKYLSKRMKVVTELTKPQQLQYKKKPKKILKILKKKNNDISKDLNALKETSEINAITPLFSLSEIIQSNTKVNLIKFKTKKGETEALFSSDDYNELKILRQHLKSSTLSKLTIELKDKSKSMLVKFTETKQ